MKDIQRPSTASGSERTNCAGIIRRSPKLVELPWYTAEALSSSPPSLPRFCSLPGSVRWVLLQVRTVLSGPLYFRHPVDRCVGTLAPWLQSVFWGAQTGGLFSVLQSAGMTIAAPSAVATTLGGVAASVGAWLGFAGRDPQAAPPPAGAIPATPPANPPHDGDDVRIPHNIDSLATDHLCLIDITAKRLIPLVFNAARASRSCPNILRVLHVTTLYSTN